MKQKKPSTSIDMMGQTGHLFPLPKIILLSAQEFEEMVESYPRREIDVATDEIPDMGRFEQAPRASHYKIEAERQQNRLLKDEVERGKVLIRDKQEQNRILRDRIGYLDAKYQRLEVEVAKQLKEEIWYLTGEITALDGQLKGRMGKGKLS